MQPGPAPYSLRIIAPAAGTIAPQHVVFTVCGVRGDGTTTPATDPQHYLVPFIDGRQVLEVMQRDHALADIPVIVISAIARETPVGASAFLRKPLSLDKLFETVRLYTEDAEPPTTENVH